MKTLLLMLILLLSSTITSAVEVIVPDDEQRTTISVNDPDASVYTLGKPEIFFDLSASQDNLLDLEIRRSGLLLPSGDPFTAFAGHREENLVILAGGSVTNVSITGVTSSSDNREALVLFRRADGSIMAPPPSNVAVFNTEFKELEFEYTPLAVPDGTTLPINILIDISGSMEGHLDDVLAATKTFLSILPEYAHCRIFVFNESVQELTPGNTALPCANTAHVLNQRLEASGGTELFKALDYSFEQNQSAIPSWELGMPNLTLVITDGIDTGILQQERLIATTTWKVAMDAYLFVFWAGNAEPERLKGLADLQIDAGADLKGALERFFESLGVSLSGLQSLKIRGH